MVDNEKALANDAVESTPLVMNQQVGQPVMVGLDGTPALQPVFDANGQMIGPDGNPAAYMPPPQPQLMQGQPGMVPM